MPYMWYTNDAVSLRQNQRKLCYFFLTVAVFKMTSDFTLHILSKTILIYTIVWSSRKSANLTANVFDLYTCLHTYLYICVGIKSAECYLGAVHKVRQHFWGGRGIWNADTCWHGGRKAIWNADVSINHGNFH